MPRFDPAETLRLVEKHRVTYLLAAPCPAWLKQAWIDWLGPQVVVELYGGTELGAVTLISGTEWLEHRGSVGRTVLGEIEIRDPEGRPLPVGAEGEIGMRRGPRVPSPYRSEPLRDDAGKVRRSALRAERIARRQPVT
jgi:bile acid-coenzyme A ligase